MPKSLKSCTCYPADGGDANRPHDECERLVRRALKGSEQERQAALEAIFFKFQALVDYMVGKSSRYLQSTDIDDLRQAIYLDWAALLESWNSKEYRFCYWCTLKAENCRARKRRGRKPDRSMDAMVLDPPLHEPDIDQDTYDCVKFTSTRFDERWQEALWMRSDGYSHEEIAEGVGVKPRQLHNWFHAMFERFLQDCW